MSADRPATPVGSGRRGWRAVVGLITIALVSAVLSGCSHEEKYGTLPTYLPSSTIRPDSVLTGSAAKPALTTQGDAVLVELTGGSVEATVSGPVVPGEGLPYQAEATTCTWTITLTKASVAVPIDLADFSTIDQFGTVYHPTILMGAETPPSGLAIGATASFKVQVVMRVGEGLMRWAPGNDLLASWDFEVEND